MDDYMRNRYAKRIEADMKARKNEKIKKYATYVGLGILLIFIVALVIQMGTGTFYADLLSMIKTSMGTSADDKNKPGDSITDFIASGVSEPESGTVWSQEQATKSEIETAPETQPETETESETTPETETEQETTPVVKPEKIEGTDLYEENPDGQTEITDIIVAKTESLYLKGDGNAWYLIKRGDTLTALAIRFNLTVESIAKENDIRNVDLIITGNELRMPVSAEVLELLKK